MAWLPSFLRPRSQEVVAPTAQEDGGGRLVPSNVSIGQLLDYFAGSGDSSALGFYTLRGGGSLFTYPTFHRCVEFISGNAANLIGDPDSLMVLRTDGKLSTSRRAKETKKLLTYSPDGEIPAHDWLEDLTNDYCVKGNGLVRVDYRMMESVPRRLTRLQSEGAYAQETENGVVYWAKSAEVARDTIQPFAASQIAHIRWPLQTINSFGAGNRTRFAKAPTMLLRPSTEVGLAADDYIRAWFDTGGNQTDTIITFDKEGTPEQQAEFQQMLSNRKSRTPLVLFDDPKVHNVGSSAQNNDTADLREFQIREVARFFGVPPAVLGEGSTDKAATKAEEIGRIAWRFGLQHHVNRILTALSFKMLGPDERLEVDPITLIRGDPASLAPLFTVMRTGPNGTGDMSRGEARRLTGLPRETAPSDELPPERVWPEDQPSQETQPVETEDE